MEGAWERQIRSVGAILTSLIKTDGHWLNDESLHTLPTEVKAIMNSQPISVKAISDVAGHQPLSLGKSSYHED